MAAAPGQLLIKKLRQLFMFSTLHNAPIFAGHPSLARTGQERNQIFLKMIENFDFVSGNYEAQQAANS